MGRSPMGAKRNGGRGTRPTTPSRRSQPKQRAEHGLCRSGVPLRATGRSAPKMPLRGLKNRYSKPHERPFFTRRGKIFNQIKHLQRYTLYKVTISHCQKAMATWFAALPERSYQSDRESPRTFGASRADKGSNDFSGFNSFDLLGEVNCSQSQLIFNRRVRAGLKEELHCRAIAVHGSHH